MPTARNCDRLTIDIGDVAYLLRRTSPNARGHWAAKANATAKLRQVAYATSVASIDPDCRQRWASANARLVLRVPDRRRRDTDNLLAACKAVFDGLADSGVVLDDCGFTHHPARIEVVPRDQVGLTVEVWP
jgi:Holliday junction resolvase RusA-like endonuclease